MDVVNENDGIVEMASVGYPLVEINEHHRWTDDGPCDVEIVDYH